MHRRFANSVMAELFESGRLVDLILALLVVEAAVVCILALTGRITAVATAWIFNLAAGGCLLLALRAVLEGADWRVAAAWLGAALLAHLADVAFRLRS
jgi:hypothetical protein